MTYEDLRNEYKKTKQELNDYVMLKGKAFKETPIIQLYMRRLDQKLEKIKQVLGEDLRKEGIGGF